LENTQIESSLTLRPYDVTRVQSPITEDITDCSAKQYAPAVQECTVITPRARLVPSTLQSVLLRVQDKLSRFGPVFQLPYSDVQHYYHIQDIVFCVKNEQLLIMLKIPIFRITARMDSYGLVKFYIPYEYLPSASIHYDIQDKYLAVTRDNGYYMELSTEDYLHCSGNELM
jgi:hypothetical protein